MNLKLVIFLLFFLPFSFVSAQTQDSTDAVQNNTIPDTDVTNEIVDDNNVIFEAENIVTDTASNNKTKIHSPKKAAWMSAAVPGLGQIYNKKYWKLPIVYGILGGLGFGTGWHADKFVKYRDEYRYRLNNNDARKSQDTILLEKSTESLKADKNMYQQRMEIFIIVTAVAYLFNILDAAVDAHLMNFNVSNDLSLHIVPSIRLNTNPLASVNKLSPTPNITFIFNLK